MTGNIGTLKSLPPFGDDISRCAELLLAVGTASDAELAERLSALSTAVLGEYGGGFYADMPPADMPLMEEISLEGRRFGCYAFYAPQTARPKLLALARLTAMALAQRKQQSQHQQIIGQIYDSIIVLDTAGFITAWNGGAERMFGYRAEEAVGRNILFLYADADAEDDSLLRDEFLEKGGRELEVRRRRKSGEVFWARLSLSRMRNAEDIPIGLIAYLSDITEQIENRRLLQLHAKIFEQSDEAIIVTDKACRIISVNPAFTRITGYAEEDILGRPLSKLSPFPDRPKNKEIAKALREQGRWRADDVALRSDGKAFPVQASINAVTAPDGEIINTICIFSDISERKRAAERIHRLAYYDAVTGLPNRSLLVELTEQALAEARRGGSSGAMMFVDLNRFKTINDSLGHEAGDALLREVGERFRAMLRDGDVVARIGDDEFVVALFDHAHSEYSALVAQRLLAALDEPFFAGAQELRIGASIGISVYPGDGESVDSLLMNADIALYRAKQSGANNYIYYSKEMNERSLGRLKIEAGLRRALANNELVLHYQPKINLANGAIIGAEALVRWQHPERGMVPPNEFIPIAEESGLIVAIGGWVLEQACAQARGWHDEGLPPIRIAANLSARQFEPGLAASIGKLLQRHGLEANWLELEITESMLMNSAEHVIDMMSALSQMGVTLSLDDFGTGYSSLTYLKRFPIDTVKIDRSFVKGTPQDNDDCAIAAAIVSMAKQLKLRVIAEGVETEAQLAFLRELGCDEMQGFLFSPAVAAEEFEAMLRGSKTLQRD